VEQVRPRARGRRSRRARRAAPFEELRDRLLGTAPLEEPILTDARHAAALERAAAALEQAAGAAAAGLSEELVLEDLREALHHLGAITGVLATGELYDHIFATFCIGK
jgi:tRNA modification GTPase